MGLDNDGSLVVCQDTDSRLFSNWKVKCRLAPAVTHCPACASQPHQGTPWFMKSEIWPWSTKHLELIKCTPWIRSWFRFQAPALSNQVTCLINMMSLCHQFTLSVISCFYDVCFWSFTRILLFFPPNFILCAWLKFYPSNNKVMLFLLFQSSFHLKFWPILWKLMPFYWINLCLWSVSSFLMYRKLGSMYSIIGTSNGWLVR